MRTKEELLVTAKYPSIFENLRHVMQSLELQAHLFFMVMVLSEPGKRLLTIGISSEVYSWIFSQKDVASNRTKQVRCSPCDLDLRGDNSPEQPFCLHRQTLARVLVALYSVNVPRGRQAVTDRRRFHSADGRTMLPRGRHVEVHHYVWLARLGIHQSICLLRVEISIPLTRPLEKTSLSKAGYLLAA